MAKSVRGGPLMRYVVFGDLMLSDLARLIGTDAVPAHPGQGNMPGDPSCHPVTRGESEDGPCVPLKPRFSRKWLDKKTARLLAAECPLAGRMYQACPLYPSKAAMLSVGIEVCFVPYADIQGARAHLVDCVRPAMIPLKLSLT